MIIIDSDILVDYLRNHKPARKFVDSTFKKRQYYISVITAIELIRGAKDRESQVVAQDLISKYQIPCLSEKISLLSYKLITKYHLSHSLAMADALIAATALKHKAQLLTKNVKDFDFIPKIKVKSPY